MRFDPSLFVPALNAANNLWSQGGPSIDRTSLPGGPNGSERVIAKGVDITQLFNGTVNASFPPGNWLGFGLDMTTVTPSDVTSVAASVLTLSRVIKLEDGGEVQKVGDVEWTIPKGVAAPSDVAGPDDDQMTFTSGTQAYQALNGDASLYARYYAVSGGLSASYAIQKSLQKSYQYLMKAHNNVQVVVHFVDYSDAINEEMLKRQLDRIAPFDPTKPDADNIEQYRSLFATLGSHIITGVTYGDRFQLQVWADNSNTEVDKDFAADVGVEFNGLTSSGKIAADIKDSTEFAAFEGTVQKTYSIRGGDAKLGAQLDANIYNESIYNTYSKWVQTTGQNPKLHSFQTIPLWDLVSVAKNDVLAKRAVNLEKAYNWIVENPKQHLTQGLLTIQSDWGELDLLSPSAFLTRGTDPPRDVFYSKNKIQWDSRGRGAVTIEIPFVIINDGSPVDIALSHGTLGSTAASGNITAVFNQVSFAVAA
ncbi:MAG: hypothetical protein Q9168_003570 [Polycauliona sp. 1 TL-2023]